MNPTRTSPSRLHRRAVGQGPAGSAPLKVVVASTQTGFRGGEVQLRLLALGLRQRGHEVTILARRDCPFAARLSEDGLQVVTFRGRGRNPLEIWRLRKLLRQLRPDVLHFNDAHALTSIGLAAKGLPIGARVAARRVAFPLRSAGRYRRGVDVMIAVSRHVADTCIGSGMPSEMLRVVYDGVQIPPIAGASRQTVRESLGICAHQTLLLCVAALTEEKGHADLLAALPGVLAAHPSVVLALAGDGPLAAQLQQQAEQLGIQQSIRWLGQRRDVPALLAAADLFVMPSRAEGLCTSVIEAQLAGVPVVSTTAGGLAEVMGTNEPDGPLGWTANVGSPAELTAAINTVLVNSVQRQANVVRAQQRAVQKFSVEQMIDGTLEVYRGVLAQRDR